MTSVLFLGFLIGMQHALEADHVAAVASLATRARTLGSVVRHGALWGLGHALTLLAVGGLVLLLGTAVPADLALWLEGAVGVMLVLLGLDVLRRLIRERVHFHRHRHVGGPGGGLGGDPGGDIVHMHAHSHAGETRAHDPRRHEHGHPRALPLRTLLVGMMHGLAGSAALLLLALASVQSAWVGLATIAIFGLGSIVGMAALSALIAVPLAYSARCLTWAHRALHAGIGAVTVAIGVLLIHEAALATLLGG